MKFQLIDGPLGLPRPLRDRVRPQLDLDTDAPPPLPEGWTPPEKISNSLGETDPEDIVSAWQGRHSRDSNGVSGLFFPEESWVVVDNRFGVHHNNQIHSLLDEANALLETFEGVLPFAWNVVGDGSVAEIGRSHGGLFQAVMRRDLDLPRYKGPSIKEGYLYDVVYALRRLDIPESSDVEFTHQHPRLSTEAVRRNFKMEAAYRELAFNDMLPDPWMDRDLSDE